MNNKFHIKITDNETGEVLFDTDTCAITGGYVTEDGAVGIALAHCNTRNHAKAIHAAETSINHLYSNHPELKLAVLLTAAGSTLEERTEK